MFIRLRQVLQRGRGQEGAAAVEFAIVLPILLLILAGFFDFGWLFFWQHSVTNASRAGARYAVQAKLVGGVSTPYTDAQITTLVKDNFGADLGVTVDRTGGTTPGSPRSVMVTKTMQWFFLNFLQSLGINLPTTIQNTTTMTVE
ncbi:MAG: pilus assembly protein [Proteobacteria bacterium]|nr:pilus assembly protein [Pseudomonadota bacterium]MBU4446946.1 pilus assembly protein [Pseudomonadota bacterium]